MRVVVTRPAVSGGRTAAKLAALGHHPLLLPLSEPHHDQEAASHALSQPHRAIVLTSGEAVRVLAALGVSAFSQTPVLAVGEATATLARQAGFAHVTCAEGTGISLAQKIIAEGHRDLLYLAGNPRSPDLEERLTKAGTAFRTVECYRMQPLVWSDAQANLLSPPPEAVLLYSQEAARLFCAQKIVRESAAHWPDCRLLCLSAKVAKGLSAAITLPVLIAPSPDEDQLLALLSA